MYLGLDGKSNLEKQGLKCSVALHLNSHTSTKIAQKISITMLKLISRIAYFCLNVPKICELCKHGFMDSRNVDISVPTEM